MSLVLIGLFGPEAWAEQAAPLPAGIALLEESVEGPYVLTGTLTTTQPAQAGLETVFNLDEQTGSHYRLSVKGPQAQFYKVSGGQAQVLGLPGKIDWRADEDIFFSLRREPWRISFIYGGQVVVRAYDSDFHGNRIGYAATGCEVGGCFLQELGEMYMTDGFMRPPGEESDWEVISGTWQQQSLRVDPQADKMQPKLSSNAFSYLGKAGEGRAMAVNGYWFWEGYSCQAAMRAVQGGAMGLVGYYQDPENYLAVRWTSRLSADRDADRLQLIEVFAGQEKILAQKRGGFIPGQWHQLRLELNAGLACVYIDGYLRLAGHTDHFGQGQVGLLVEGDGGVFFDDFLIRPWRVLSEKFAQFVPGKWQVLSGKWSLGTAGIARVETTSEAAVVSGDQGWVDFKYGTDVQAKSGGLGLIFAYTSPADYCLFRWADASAKVAYRGQAQIVHVTTDQHEVLAGESLTYHADGKVRAKVTIQRGLITGWLNERQQVQAVQVDLPAGAVGLYAEGADSASFDNLYVEELPPPPAAHLVKESTDIKKHHEMAEWASRRAPWVTPEQPDRADAEWRTKGDYFGDKTVEFTLNKIGSTAGTMFVTVDANPAQGFSGYTLSITAENGSQTLQAALLAGDNELASAAVEVSGDSCAVRLVRQGQYLIAIIDDQVVFKQRVE